MLLSKCLKQVPDQLIATLELILVQKVETGLLKTSVKAALMELETVLLSMILLSITGTPKMQLLLLFQTSKCLEEATSKENVELPIQYDVIKKSSKSLYYNKCLKINLID